MSLALREDHLRTSKIQFTNLGEQIAYEHIKADLAHMNGFSYPDYPLVAVIHADLSDIPIFKSALEIVAEHYRASELPTEVWEYRGPEDDMDIRARLVTNVSGHWLRGEARAFIIVPFEYSLPDSVLDVAAKPVYFVGANSADIENSARIFYDKLNIAGSVIHDLAGYTLSDYATLCPRSLPIESAVRMLKELSDSRKPKAEKGDHSEPLLEDLSGYGEASDWAQDLKQDLADFAAKKISWDDIDRGILLSGAPGTGKTTFAAALARSCDIPLVTGSVAKWQSRGHLGDLLKAMRAAFKTATEEAPCIFLIDELDSIGNRDQSHGDNSQYVREAINGLLECLDGAEKRTGVVVVGTTNHPDAIDGGILRPGRLDRHIRIPLPDAAAREGILRFHLKEHLPDVDLTPVIEMTEDQSGADLEQISRGARRVARRAQREMVLDDLISQLPPVIPTSDEELRRIAVHELGHAVVAIDSKIGEISEVKISRYATSKSVSAGHVDLKLYPVRLSTVDLYHAKIRMWLAGLAAEDVFFGNRTDGSGGVTGSDLQQATLHAIAVHTALGFNDIAQISDLNEKSLMRAYYGFSDVRQRVHETLEKCLSEAKSVVERYQNEIETLASVLVEKGRLDGNDVKQALERTAALMRVGSAVYVH